MSLRLKFNLVLAGLLLLAVLGEPVNKVSFRRKVDELAMLEPVPGALQTGGAHRPAQLYRVRPAYRRQLSLSTRGL